MELQELKNALASVVSQIQMCNTLDEKVKIVKFVVSSLADNAKPQSEVESLYEFNESGISNVICLVLDKYVTTGVRHSVNDKSIQLLLNEIYKYV